MWVLRISEEVQHVTLKSLTIRWFYLFLFIWLYRVSRATFNQSLYQFRSEYKRFSVLNFALHTAFWLLGRLHLPVFATHQNDLH